MWSQSQNIATASCNVGSFGSGVSQVTCARNKAWVVVSRTRTKRWSSWSPAWTNWRRSRSRERVFGAETEKSMKQRTIGLVKIWKKQDQEMVLTSQNVFFFFCGGRPQESRIWNCSRHPDFEDPGSTKKEKDDKKGSKKWLAFSSFSCCESNCRIEEWTSETILGSGFNIFFQQVSGILRPWFSGLKRIQSAISLNHHWQSVRSRLTMIIFRAKFAQPRVAW